MKDRIITNGFRSIKRFFPRFLSLMVMSMLGVFVYVGLQATAPDMMATLDTYLDNQNVYDVRIISTLGLTEDEIVELEKIENIENVEGSISEDVIWTLEEKEHVIQITSLPKTLNTLELNEGEFPLKENEIVVDKNLLEANDLKIGDTISFESNSLKEKEFTIVGVITSPMYYNNAALGESRGSTSIGMGSINYYAYTLESSFDVDYYTAVYVSVSNTRDYVTASDDYVEAVEQITTVLNERKEEFEMARYQDIYEDAKKEIDEAEAEVKEELASAEKELASANTELTNARRELQSARNLLSSNKQKLDEAYATLQSNKQQIQNQLNQLGLTESTLNINITTLEASVLSMQQILQTLLPGSNEYVIYSQQLQEIEQNLSSLKTLKGAIDAINEGEKEYQKNLATYQSAYKTYQSNYSLYSTNLTEYENAVKTFESEKTSALNEIERARNDLKNLEKPKWYIYDRTNYSTYMEYTDDTSSISNLSKIFPFVFFAVAILVSLISMNRMVEDDRTEIGTLKSLGFPNKKIMTKYLLFSFLAVVVGSILGCILGNLIIPGVIFSIYSIMFDVPNFQVVWDIPMMSLGFLISFLCVCGTTVFTVYKVLKEKPSELMRPKAPKKGKRVFLEHIPFLWNHMNFSNKVTLRNLFRYKKRVFVTIVGIAGCTALILCGFGVKDGIVDLTDMQYGETFHFDAMAYMNDMSDEEITETFKRKEINSSISIESLSATLNKTELNIMVYDDPEKMEEIVTLKTPNNEEVGLDSKTVYITDKLADVKDISIGDEIKVIDVDGFEYTFTIGGIVKNYVGHILYVPKDIYEKYKKYEPNLMYLQTQEFTDEEEDAFKSSLLENDKIINVSFIQALKDSVSNMLQSLDKVVFILIILASMLAFVVLYNLSNININERKREIATLKVLGFYHKEVDSYITRENIIFTILGIGIGLVLGYFLTNIVITTVEIEKARFIHNISFLSFLYSALIASTFTIIVNFVTHFSLKKIDMIESLKSVE